MKKYLFAILAICFFACDDDPETNLTGTWRYIEPPSAQSRFNRLDGSIPAFDLVFFMSGREIKEADLWLDGKPVDEDFTYSDHESSVDLYFTSGDFSISLLGCRRINQIMFVETIEYAIPGKGNESLKGISVGRWDD